MDARPKDVLGREPPLGTPRALDESCPEEDPIPGGLFAGVEVRCPTGVDASRALLLPYAVERDGVAL